MARNNRKRPALPPRMQPIPRRLIVGSPQDGRAIIYLAVNQRAALDDSRGSQMPANSSGAPVLPWIGYVPTGPRGPGVYVNPTGVAGDEVAAVTTGPGAVVYRSLALAPVTSWTGTEFYVQTHGTATTLTGLEPLSMRVKVRGVVQRAGSGATYDTLTGIVTLAEAPYASGETTTNATTHCWVEYAEGPRT